MSWGLDFGAVLPPEVYSAPSRKDKTVDDERTPTNFHCITELTDLDYVRADSFVN